MPDLKIPDGWTIEPLPTSVPAGWTVESTPAEGPGVVQRAIGGAIKGSTAGIPGMMMGAAEGAFPGAAEALGRGAVQGATLGFGDEIGAAANALGTHLSDKPKFMDRYREIRDASRKDNAQAAEGHGLATAVGEIAGGAPAALAATGAKVPSLLRLLAVGSGLGGANALGNSRADLTQGDFAGAGKDVAAGVATGAVTALAPAALGAAARRLGPLGVKIEQAALGMGRRVLGGGSEPLSTKLPIPDASVRAAFDVGAIKPFGTTEHAANVLSDALEQAGSIKGDVVKQIEEAGIDGPLRSDVAQKIRATAAELRRTTAGTGKPQLLERIAREIEEGGATGAGAAPEGVLPHDREVIGLVRGGVPPSESGMPVGVSESIKSSLQRAAKYGRRDETLLNEGRREAARIMRQAIEEAVMSNAQKIGTPQAMSAAEALIPAKQSYATLAPAAQMAEQGLGQAAKRNAISLRDMLVLGPMLAAKGPGAALEAGIASKMLRTYGPSTAAWGLDKTAKMASRVSAKSQAIADLLRSHGIPALTAEAIDNERSR